VLTETIYLNRHRTWMALPGPSRIGHLNAAEYRANRGAAGVLARVPPGAASTSTSFLQLFACLLGDYKILHAFGEGSLQRKLIWIQPYKTAGPDA
jgi:hypothetical protein